MDTFGRTTNTSASSSISGVIRGEKGYSPAYDGYARGIIARINSYSDTLAKTALYDGNDLVAETMETQIFANGGVWRDISFNFVEPVPVYSTTSYTLVVWAKSGTISAYYGYAAGGTGVYQTLAYGAYPDPASFTEENDRGAPIWCVYQEEDWTGTDPLWVMGSPYASHLTNDTDVRWALGAPYPPVLKEYGLLTQSFSEVVSYLDTLIDQWNIKRDIIMSLSIVGNILNVYGKVTETVLDMTDYALRECGWFRLRLETFNIPIYMTTIFNSTRTITHDFSITDYLSSVSTWTLTQLQSMSLPDVFEYFMEGIGQLLVSEAVVLVEYISNISEWKTVQWDSITLLDYIDTIFSATLTMAANVLMLDQFSIFSEWSRITSEDITAMDYMYRISNWKPMHTEPIGMLQYLDKTLSMILSAINTFSMIDHFDKASTWVISRLQSTSLWDKIIVPLQDIPAIQYYYYKLIFGDNSGST